MMEITQDFHSVVLYLKSCVEPHRRHVRAFYVLKFLICYALYCALIVEISIKPVIICPFGAHLIVDIQSEH